MQTEHTPNFARPQASDNVDYRDSQVPLGERQLDHLYGFRVSRPNERRQILPTTTDLS